MGAGAPAVLDERAVLERFWALVVADDELVDAEFATMVVASWGPPAPSDPPSAAERLRRHGRWFRSVHPRGGPGMHRRIRWQVARAPPRVMCGRAVLVPT